MAEKVRIKERARKYFERQGNDVKETPKIKYLKGMGINTGLSNFYGENDSLGSH